MGTSMQTSADSRSPISTLDLKRTRLVGVIDVQNAIPALLGLLLIRFARISNAGENNGSSESDFNPAPSSSSSGR